MKKRNPRQRGLYVLGQRGTGCKRLAGQLLTLQDNLTGIPLVLSDPIGKTLSELVKEVLTDATKKQKPSQPKAEDENPDTTV
jgi:hypothetical protein